MTWCARLYIAMMVGMVGGCAANPVTTSSQEPGQTPSPRNGPVAATYKYPIYGLLKKTGTGYQLVYYRIAASPPSKAEAWVNLATGEPYWDTNQKRCGKGLVKDRHQQVPDCSKVASDDLFMESKFDKGDAAIRALGAVVTMGMTLTGTSYDVTFNKEKYDAAYKVAIGRIESSKLAAIDNELMSFNEDHDKRQRAYDTAVSGTTIDVHINDKSGLFSSQVDFQSMVSLNKSYLTAVGGYMGATLEELLENMKKRHQELQQEWQDQIKEAKVRCSEGPSAGFVFSMQCPPKTQVGEVKITVFVNVESRSFKRVMPGNIRARDNVLSLNFDGNRIGLENMSTRFVTVDSIAFYYGDKISKVSDLKLELAPDSKLLPENELDIKRFPVKWDILDYTGMTRTKAEKTSVAFGFAVKYRIMDINREQTLFSQKKYRLYDLIVPAERLAGAGAKTFMDRNHAR